METNWVQYKCKSGRTLLICNKNTEHNSLFSSSDSLTEGNDATSHQPVMRKVCSVGTQTDDTGCQNGCTSMYINAGPVVNGTQASLEGTTIVLNNEVRDDLDVEPAALHVDIGLDDGTREDRTRDMHEMVTIYLGSDGDNFSKDKRDKNKSSVQKQTLDKCGKKGFECSYCKKTFKFKCSFQDHIKTHTGEKPFECSYCKKRFVMKSNLKEHVKTHTGEKPFECSHCQKRFTLKKNMTHHVRIHTGEKPFECSYCEKKFARKDGLKTHHKMHTGEKPHECSYCKKKFGQRKHLNVHLKIHTRENMFECSYCKKEFTRKDNLKTHLKTHMGR